MRGDGFRQIADGLRLQETRSPGFDHDILLWHQEGLREQTSIGFQCGLMWQPWLCIKESR